MRNSKSEVISLDRRAIRVIRDSKGGIQRFCLNDLCAYLGRDFVRPNQDATRLCPKSVKLPFKLNGHRMWSITPAEVKTLTETVLREKPGAESRCHKLEEWVKELNAPKPKPTAAEKDDTPVTFNFQDRNPVSFRFQNDRMWINATQLTKCFNRQPIEWLRLKDTIRTRSKLAEEGITASVEQQLVTVRGRNNGATWMEVPLALELADWLSPELTAWCRECIRKMTTEPPVEEEPDEPAETLPEELLPEGIDKFPVPKTFSEALQLAADLQEKLEQNEPKVAYYEDQIESRECFSTTRLADELRISAQQLNRFLEDQGVCRRDLKQWVACGDYRRYQTEVPYMFHSKRGKAYKCGSALRWNQPGREYIIDLWKTHHPASHE